MQSERHDFILVLVAHTFQRRETADQIAKRMVAEGHHVTSLHGAKDARERDQVIDDFRDGKSKVLITTNVVARGIDILQVNMVVNYDMPLTADNHPDVETYLHRIGKTARFFIIPYSHVRFKAVLDDLGGKAYL